MFEVSAFVQAIHHPASGFGRTTSRIATKGHARTHAVNISSSSFCTSGVGGVVSQSICTTSRYAFNSGYKHAKTQDIFSFFFFI